MRKNISPRERLKMRFQSLREKLGRGLTRWRRPAAAPAPATPAPLPDGERDSFPRCPAVSAGWRWLCVWGVGWSSMVVPILGNGGLAGSTERVLTGRLPGMAIAAQRLNILFAQYLLCIVAQVPVNQSGRRKRRRVIGRRLGRWRRRRVRWRTGRGCGRLD